MIKQHIFTRSPDGCRTAAVSPALRESAWLPLLEQQSQFHYESDVSVPVYFQYPLGTGLVLSRYSVGPVKYDTFAAHQLVAVEAADLSLLNAARPLPDYLFFSGFTEQNDEPAPLPPLDPADFAGAGLLSEGFRLIDALFDESLLAGLFESLLLAARDKQQMIHILIDQPPAIVSAQGRLLMEMLMRCLPVREVARLSWCTLTRPSASPMAYSVCISPCSQESASEFSAIESRCIQFDLKERFVSWPEATPAIGTRSVQLARALLAHDLDRIDALRAEAAPASRPSHASKQGIPPFEPGMTLTQYINDWADTMEIRRSVLNDEAFKTLAREEWPRLIGRIIDACDMMPNREFVSQLNDSLILLVHGRGSSLGMENRHTRDLISVLLDSPDWDSIDLLNPDTRELITSVTEYADQFAEEPSDRGCFAACRIMHAALTAPTTRLGGIMENLSILSDEFPELFQKVQSCARRYVADRCRLSKKKNKAAPLSDDAMVVFSVIGYARFTGGVPDLRQLDKVRETVAKTRGKQEARLFSARLDKLRKHIRAAHAAGQIHGPHLTALLLIALGLSLIIIGIVLAYFLFPK